MKRYFNIPLAMILLAGIVVVSAKAQTTSAQRVIANIPFAFTVGAKTLPAGRYTIAVLNPSSDRKTLQVRSMDGRSSAIVLTTNVSGNASENAKLVFDRYGDHYYFAQAQMAGDSPLAAVRSKAERAEMLAIAKSKKKSVVTIVAG
jgi:hypothetical protein